MDQNGLVELLLPNDEFSYALHAGLSFLFSIKLNLREKVGRRDREIGKECAGRLKEKN